MAQTQTAPEVNLGDVLRQVAREKEIDYDRWVQALEDAMASAAKKQHRIKEPVRAHFDRETGYPMAWYFHMLSSKSVPHWVADCVVEDSLSGYGYLPQCDVNVVRGWLHRPYSV